MRRVSEEQRGVMVKRGTHGKENFTKLFTVSVKESCINWVLSLTYDDHER